MRTEKWTVQNRNDCNFFVLSEHNGNLIAQTHYKEDAVQIVTEHNTLDEAKAVLEKYTHYGQLQSFESREQFRTEAGAVLAKLEGGAR